MDANTFAVWLRRQGHRVFRTTSSFWYDAGPRVLQAFPYHWEIQPDPHELRELILRNNILALRYSTRLDADEGKASYHVVLDDPNYCLEKLRNQARNGIRRGLEKCHVERISFERLADEGWKLQQDTLDRQNRLNSMSQTEWQRICLSAVDLPGFEAWGAIVGDDLAASILTCRIDEKCYVPYAQSHRDYLGFHVNNALFYTASREMLSRQGVSGIFFCLQSLDAPESVDEFKFRMGFTPKPIRQRIAFHPILKPLAGSQLHRSIISLIARNPNSAFLAKMEGMIRFYRHGKIPLDSQEWPKCLADFNAEHFC
jgi:hypothetical protein